MLCSDKGAEFVSFMRYDLRPNKHVLPARLCMNSCTPLSGGSAGRRPVAALHSMGQRHQGGWAGLRALQQRYLQAQLTSKHARSPSAVAAPKRPVAEQPPAAAVDR